MQSKLPENLKALRKSRGWTQQALADRLGLTRPTWSLRGGPLRTQIVGSHRHCCVFNITVDALVRGSDSEMRTERAKGDGLILTVSVDSRMTTSALWWFPSKLRRDMHMVWGRVGFPSCRRLGCL